MLGLLFDLQAIYRMLETALNYMSYESPPTADFISDIRISMQERRKKH